MIIKATKLLLLLVCVRVTTQSNVQNIDLSNYYNSDTVFFAVRTDN